MRKISKDVIDLTEAQSLKERLGTNIFLCRTALGVTREELAEKLGVKETTIRHYESGFRTPPLEKLVAMAEILGASTDALLGRTREDILELFAKK